MKKRKNIENLALDSSLLHSKSKITTANSSKLTSENIDFKFAAGFPPFLRGSNATPTPTKLIKFCKLYFFKKEGEQLVLTLQLFEGTEHQIYSASELATTLQKLDSETIIQIENSQNTLLILGILGAALQQHPEKKISVQIHFNVHQHYSETEKNRIISKKIILNSFNSTFYKNSLSLIISEKGLAKSTFSIEYRLAFCLFQALNFLKKEKKIETAIRFEWQSSSDYFLEIAKIRAVRALWSTLIKKYKLASSPAKSLYSFSNISYSSTANSKQASTAVLESSAALLSETQGIQLKETKGLPVKKITEYLEKEALMGITTDPWGGSFYVENLTQSLIEKTWKIISEIEKAGAIAPTFEEGNFSEKLLEKKLLSTNQKTDLSDFDFSIIQFNSEKKVDSHIIDPLLKHLNQASLNTATILDLVIEAIVSGAPINDVKNSLDKAILN